MIILLVYLSKAFISGLVILDRFHAMKNAGVENSSTGEITGIPHVWGKVYCLPFLLDELLPLENWYEFYGGEGRAVS